MLIDMPKKEGGWTKPSDKSPEPHLDTEEIHTLTPIDVSEILSSCNEVIETSSSMYEERKDKHLGDAIIHMLAAKRALNLI